MKGATMPEPTYCKLCGEQLEPYEEHGNGLCYACQDDQESYS